MWPPSALRFRIDTGPVDIHFFCSSVGWTRAAGVTESEFDGCSRAVQSWDDFVAQPLRQARRSTIRLPIAQQLHLGSKKLGPASEAIEQSMLFELADAIGRTQRTNILSPRQNRMWAGPFICSAPQVPRARETFFPRCSAKQTNSACSHRCGERLPGLENASVERRGIFESRVEMTVAAAKENQRPRVRLQG